MTAKNIDLDGLEWSKPEDFIDRPVEEFLKRTEGHYFRFNLRIGLFTGAYKDADDKQYIHCYCVETGKQYRFRCEHRWQFAKIPQEEAEEKTICIGCPKCDRETDFTLEQFENRMQCMECSVCGHSDTVDNWFSGSGMNWGDAVDSLREEAEEKPKMKCPKCGELESHFCPPSFGDAGFYTCEAEKTKAIPPKETNQPNPFPSDVVEKEEPEFITSETDAGFRKVMEAACLHPETIETQSKGMGQSIHWVDAGEHSKPENIAMWVFRDGYHSRIRNPNFKPKKEPKVFDIWEAKENRRLSALVTSIDNSTVNYILSNGANSSRDIDIFSLIFDFTGRTINLSALAGGD